MGEAGERGSGEAGKRAEGRCAWFGFDKDTDIGWHLFLDLVTRALFEVSATTATTDWGIEDCWSPAARNMAYSRHHRLGRLRLVKI